MERRLHRATVDDINVRDLRVHFPTNDALIRAVDAVSVTFRHEEITAVIGETGCGKSVLGLAMLGLLPSEARVYGEVLYRGESVLALSGRRRRRYRNEVLSLIPQNPSSSLNPVRRVANQVMDAITALGTIPAAVARVRAEQSLARLTLSGRSALYPFQMSGGMRERVLVSIGTVRQPMWLLADEPTKGLDRRLHDEVAALFSEMARERGRGIILITHDVHLAVSSSQRVLVMYGGHVVEDIPAKVLLKRPAHPYTQGLLRALPENGFHPMDGAPLGIGSLPSGCRFFPRCPIRQDRCAEAVPPLREYAEDHSVRCILA